MIRQFDLNSTNIVFMNDANKFLQFFDLDHSYSFPVRLASYSFRHPISNTLKVHLHDFGSCIACRILPQIKDSPKAIMIYPLLSYQDFNEIVTAVRNVQNEIKWGGSVIFIYMDDPCQINPPPPTVSFEDIQSIVRMHSLNHAECFCAYPFNERGKLFEEYLLQYLQDQ